MKKIIIYLLSTALLFSFAACQPTPEKVIVRGKNLDNMIEMATTQQPDEGVATDTSGANGQSIEANTNLLADKLGAPQTYSTDLVDPMGKVTIHVDADVSIPNSNAIAVQRVQRGKFSQEQIDTLFSMLVKGQPFSGDSYKPTKEEIQQQILEVQAAQSRPQSESANPERDLYNGQRYEFLMQDLTQQLDDAPDVSSKNPVTSQLLPMNEEIDFAKGEKVYALAQSEQGGYESFRAYNYNDVVSVINYTSEKSAFSNNMGYFVSQSQIKKDEQAGYTPYMTSAEAESLPDVSITQEDAKAQAEAIISALGITDMTCYSAEKAYGGSYDTAIDGITYKNPRKSVWFLRYERIVNDIAITYTAWDCIKVEDGAQSAPWAYEDMTFAIDDSGIVGFHWNSPYKVTDTITQNTNMISFDEVTSVFDTLSLAVNAWDGFAYGNPNLTSIEITVDNIKLGLTRITEKDKRDSGLLVPAWDFFGTTTYVMEVDGQEKRYSDGPIPVLTVNAIDGSIINRSLGY